MLENTIICTILVRNQILSLCEAYKELNIDFNPVYEAIQALDNFLKYGNMTKNNIQETLKDTLEIRKILVELAYTEINNAGMAE